MQKKFIFYIFGIALFALCIFGVLPDTALANQITLGSGNFSKPGGFGVIAGGEGFTVDIYSHFGNTVATAQKICALTSKYYRQLGLSEPHTVYVSKTATNFVSCWNDHTYTWQNGQWSNQGACTIGSYLDHVTCATPAKPNCTPHASKRCLGGDVFWYNSCGQAESMFQNCPAGCSNGACIPVCTPQASRRCVGNNLYWFNSCNQQGALVQNCPLGCSNGACQGSNCTPHASKQCTGNNLYWFNSCGVQQELFQTCTNGCSNGACNGSNPTGQCSSNANCPAPSFSGNPFCQDGKVYRNQTTYNCNNPGTANSFCSASSAPQLVQACGAGQTCFNGSCNDYNVRCSSNSECGSNSFSGNPFCQNGNVYRNQLVWSCNNPGTTQSYCSSTSAPQQVQVCSTNQVCTNGLCTLPGNNNNNNNNNCTANSYQRCSGNNLYWFDSCGVQGGLYQYCTYGCSGSACLNNNNNNNNCNSHSYQQCSGNYLYWYDSCGNRQDSQYCQYGCNNNWCNGNNNNNNNNYCTYHAYRDCLGNSIYWYSSCGSAQDFYQACGAGQTCKYGQCVTNYVPVPVPPPAPNPTYIKYYRIACASNSIYWYDSLGLSVALYKTCNDSNTCTKDSCSYAKCSNTLKCDGSTCAQGSADYAKYCAINQPDQQVNISVNFFAKKDPNAVAWDKIIQVVPNSTIYFLAVVKNDTNKEVLNANISAVIPAEVTMLGNIKIDNTPVSGDIVNGIIVSSIPANGTKTISFEGKTQNFTQSGDKQATANAKADSSTQTDSLTLNFAPAQTGAISGAPATSGFWGFLKRWYLWIFIALVAIFLFVIIFRRLSAD